MIGRARLHPNWVERVTFVLRVSLIVPPHRWGRVTQLLPGSGTLEQNFFPVRPLLSSHSRALDTNSRDKGRNKDKGKENQTQNRYERRNGYRERNGRE
jgi:hypothetical protein